jgi:acyl-CoA synthetase
LIRKLIANKKVNVFNIYGITELSCWSTLHHLKEDDFDFDDESILNVPIGMPLNETKLFLKQSTQEIFTNIEDLITDDNLKKYEGVLYHSSKTRICYIDGQNLEFANSGDYATVTNKKIYLSGRIDDLLKINGKLTSLKLLENVIILFYKI